MHIQTNISVLKDKVVILRLYYFGISSIRLPEMGLLNDSATCDTRYQERKCQQNCNCSFVSIHDKTPVCAPSLLLIIGIQGKNYGFSRTIEKLDSSN